MYILTKARFAEFSNLCLGVYTPYAHENSNQSLVKRFRIQPAFRDVIESLQNIKSLVIYIINIISYDKKAQFMKVCLNFTLENHKYMQLPLY